MIYKTIVTSLPGTAIQPASGSATTPFRVRSDALLGAAKQLVIVHNGREYRLRLTQNDKLILTA
jgi:hemin uptake protein HemP